MSENLSEKLEMSSIAEASDLIRRAAEPRPVGDSVKAAISRAAPAAIQAAIIELKALQNFIDGLDSRDKETAETIRRLEAIIEAGTEDGAD